VLHLPHTSFNGQLFPVSPTNTLVPPNSDEQRHGRTERQMHALLGMLLQLRCEMLFQVSSITHGCNTRQYNQEGTTLISFINIADRENSKQYYATPLTNILLNVVI